MSNERLVGSIKPWQDRTPAPNDLPRTAQANHERDLGLVKATKKNAFAVAVGSDTKRGRVGGQISSDQSGRVWGILKVLHKEKPSDVGLEDLQAIRTQLNTLSDRVDFLCAAATSGIDALLPRAGEGKVSSNEVLASSHQVIRESSDGLDRVFPDHPNEVGILFDVLMAAKGAGRTGTETYLRAASDALRCKVQECLISDAIMERFADRVQGDPLSVKPSIIDRVFGALSATTGIMRTPEDAGNLGSAERQALDALLEDAGKTKPETLPGLIAATADQPEEMWLAMLYPAELPHRVLLNELAGHFPNDEMRQIYVAEALLHKTFPDKARRDDGIVPWNDLTVGDLLRVVKEVEKELAPPLPSPDGPRLPTLPPRLPPGL